MRIAARREDADLYVARARATMAEVDGMSARMRALVYEHGLLAVHEGQSFAGADMTKLEGFLAKRRERRQRQALAIQITLN